MFSRGVDRHSDRGTDAQTHGRTDRRGGWNSYLEKMINMPNENYQKLPSANEVNFGIYFWMIDEIQIPKIVSGIFFQTVP